MSIDRIARMLAECSSDKRVFPATDLYNEGWMLRLVLDWFVSRPGIEHDLAFSAEDRWYSEALLPSAFLPRFRGDPLSESWTHADGVIGQFQIGAKGDGDLSLSSRATRLVVTEAKMFSKLSSGVKNATFFNQAARNVACIAEVLRRAEAAPERMQRIGFFVVAPQSQIDGGVFSSLLQQDAIREVVAMRVAAYESEDKTRWFHESFMPTLDRIRIGEISWESLVQLISEHDPGFGTELANFYAKCLDCNQFVLRRFN